MSDKSCNMTARNATENFFKNCSHHFLTISLSSVSIDLSRSNVLFNAMEPIIYWRVLNKTNLRRFNLLRKKNRNDELLSSNFQRWRFLSRIIMLEYHFSPLHPAFKIIGFNVWTFLYTSQPLRTYPLLFLLYFIAGFFDLSELIGRGSEI